MPAEPLGWQSKKKTTNPLKPKDHKTKIGHSENSQQRGEPTPYVAVTALL
jgi:hypothetical protein